MTATATEKPAPTRPRPRWWRRPWMAPLLVLAIAFLAVTLPPYLTFDPAQSRLPLRVGFDLHYPMLVAHILFGTVALLTCCLQVWPWLRQRHPKIHRWSGRIYVVGGVLPAGLLALVVSVASTQSGLVGRVGNTLLALVWLGTTFAGYRMARQRRFADHRRWMIRSFALCTSIVVNRVWLIIFLVGVSPFQDSLYGGDEAAMIRAAAEASIWMSWVVNLLIAEWWLERRRTPKRRTPRPA